MSNFVYPLDERRARYQLRNANNPLNFTLLLIPLRLCDGNHTTGLPEVNKINGRHSPRLKGEDSQLPTLPRAERLMQRAETLLPASTRGLTAPSLRALSERHPFRDRLTGRVPPLVCSLLRSYLRSLCDRNFDSGILACEGLLSASTRPHSEHF
jgi:hypothetical protein